MFERIEEGAAAADDDDDDNLPFFPPLESNSPTSPLPLLALSSFFVESIVNRCRRHHLRRPATNNSTSSITMGMGMGLLMLKPRERASFFSVMVLLPL